MAPSTNSTRVIVEKFVRVRDVVVHYVKVGCGNHVVLFLHGFLGSAWLDFKSQLNKMCIDGLTLIAWDGPGCGKSRPPDKVVAAGYIKQDAVYAREMMLALGYSKFSIVSWCNGGFAAMELAATYRENVLRLIIIGSKAFYTQQDIYAIRKICCIEYIAKWRQDDLLSVYDRNYVNSCWSQLVNYVEETFNTHDGEICRMALPLIRAPTLIIHGDRDRVVPKEHAFYLHKHISGSKLILLDDASHATHITHPESINTILEHFLNDKDTL